MLLLLLVIFSRIVNCYSDALQRYECCFVGIRIQEFIYMQMMQKFIEV